MEELIAQMEAALGQTDSTETEQTTVPSTENVDTNQLSTLDTIPEVDNPFEGTGSVQPVGGTGALDSIPEITNPFEVDSSGPDPIDGAGKVIKRGKGGTVKITPENVRNMTYEQIYALSQNGSPVSDEDRSALAFALGGSTTTGLGELFLGSPLRHDELEGIVEEKYQDFITRNPEKAQSFFARVGSALTRGTAAPRPDGVEGNPEVSGTRAFLDTAANSATFGFSDEIFDALGAEETAAQQRASRDQIYDDSTIAGIAADIVGGVGSGGVALKAAGKLVGGPFKRLVTAGAIDGAVTGAGVTEGTLGDRANNALIGGTVGAVLAPVASSVGKLLPKAANAVFRGKKGKALQKMVDTISEESGVSQIQILEGLRQGISLDQIINEVSPDPVVTAKIINKNLADNNLSNSKVIEIAKKRVNKIVKDESIIADNAITNNTDNTLSAGESVEAALRAATPDQIQANMIGILNGSEVTRMRPAIKESVADILNTDRGVSALQEARIEVAKPANVILDNSTGRSFLKPKSLKVDKEGNFKVEDLIEVTELIDGTVFARASDKIRGSANPKMQEGSGVDQFQGFDIERAAKEIEVKTADGISDLAESNAAFSNAKDTEKLFDLSSTMINSGKKISPKTIKDFKSLVDKSNLSTSQKIDIVRSAFANANASQTLPVLSPLMKQTIDEAFGDTTLSTSMKKLNDELVTLSAKGNRKAYDAYKDAAQSAIDGAVDTLGPFTPVRQTGSNFAIAAFGAISGMLKHGSRIKPEHKAIVAEMMLDANPDLMSKQINRALSKAKKRDFINTFIEALATGGVAGTAAREVVDDFSPFGVQ